MPEARWNVPVPFATLNSTRSAAMRPSGLEKTTFPLATRRSSGSVKTSMTSAENPMPGHSISACPVSRTRVAESLSNTHCVFRVQALKKASPAAGTAAV